MPSGPREICLCFKPPSNEIKGGEEAGGGAEEEEEEEEEKEELKAFAKMKKLNQYISTSPGSTTCRNTYN